MALDTDWESSELDGDAAPNHLDTLSSNGCHLFSFASSDSWEFVMEEYSFQTLVATKVLDDAVSCEEH